MQNFIGFFARLELMSAAEQVCVFTLYSAMASDVNPFSSVNYSRSSILELLADMAPKIDDVLVECNFRDEVRNCNQLFTPTITESGFCFSFNAVHNNEIFSDE